MQIPTAFFVCIVSILKKVKYMVREIVCLYQEKLLEEKLVSIILVKYLSYFLLCRISKMTANESVYSMFEGN